MAQLWHLFVQFESLGFDVDPLTHLNELKHQFGVFCDIKGFKSITVQQNVEMSAGIDPANPVLLEELKSLSCHDNITVIRDIVFNKSAHSFLDLRDQLYPEDFLLLEHRVRLGWHLWLPFFKRGELSLDFIAVRVHLVGLTVVTLRDRRQILGHSSLSFSSLGKNVDVHHVLTLGGLLASVLVVTRRSLGRAHIDT